MKTANGKINGSKTATDASGNNEAETIAASRWAGGLKTAANQLPRSGSSTRRWTDGTMVPNTDNDAHLASAARARHTRQNALALWRQTASTCGFHRCSGQRSGSGGSGAQRLTARQ